MSGRIYNIKLKNGREAKIFQGAFGSGEHETTKACIKHLENMELSGKSVLDVGCGTGILGICASMLGAEKCIGYDLFYNACKTAKECNELNGVTNNHIICGLQDCINSKFDIIFANIYFDISEFVRSSLASGGKVVLSGIPVEFNYDVRRCYERLGFNIIETNIHEEFSTILMSR